MGKEEKIKKLIKKVDAIDGRSRKELMAELRIKLQMLKEQKLLPKGYAQAITDKLELSNINKVYQTLAGLNADLDIAEEIINMATEKKREQQLIDKANEILDAE